MKKYFLFLLTICLTIFSVSSCKKDKSCPVAFNYTIVDSTTLQPLIGYHSGAKYDPELFEFQMNVKAEKEITYQIRQDSGAVFTISLSNILEKNIVSNSYVLYDGIIFDTLEFGSTSPAPGYEAVFSNLMFQKLKSNSNKDVFASLYCSNGRVIDTLTIKN